VTSLGLQVEERKRTTKRTLAESWAVLANVYRRLGLEDDARRAEAKAVQAEKDEVFG
jgi:hypothetical protein